MRAAARALTGDRPAELAGAGPVELAGALGRTLCAAVVHAKDVDALLGAELVARLRTWPLVRVLGDRLHSIDELALMFPDTIRYCEDDAEPVAGFPVVLSEAQAARAIGVLARRAVRDAARELAAQRALLARALRLAAHRERPARPLALPYPGVKVQLASKRARGFVGVAPDVFELHLDIEGRPFQVIRRHDEPPVCAALELDADAADATFEAVRPELVEALVTAVRETTPALLLEIATARPEAPTEPGPARTLFATWAARHALSRKRRAKLAQRVTFPTLQGGRVTVAAAADGAALATSSWHGAWLAPEPDDERHALDRPVIHLPPGGDAVRTILFALHEGDIEDVTDEVTKLQAQRQMLRGLLPSPKVDAPAELTRRLDELGEAARALGPGQLALVPGPAVALLHVNGVLREVVPLDVMPAVAIALEAPELVGELGQASPELADGNIAAQLRALRDDRRVDRSLEVTVQALAGQLARQVLAAVGPAALPHEIRASLRRAVLAQRVERDAFDAVPLFPTSDGRWIDVQALRAQQALLGDLWCITAVDPAARPLDERRLVLVLDEVELQLARVHGWAPIAARGEAELDAQTRRNLARAPATTLEIGPVHVLANVELSGDGVTAPRGVVAVLHPAAAGRRGLRTHRAMHPFDLIEDPCRWPTLAVVDDASLSPDRTWQVPVEDPAYKQLVRHLRETSEHALRAIAPAPDDALAAIRVAPATYDGLRTLRGRPGVQLRGAMWLAGPPHTGRGVINVSYHDVEWAYVPPHDLGMAGRLYVHGPAGPHLDEVLAELTTLMYGKLVRTLCAEPGREPDAVAAHAALALELERILAADAKHVRFPCFAPMPLTAYELAALLGRVEPVHVVTPGDDDLDGFALVADGSTTANVIQRLLGHRARRVSARAVRPPAPKSPGTRPPPAPPRPAHPLQGFVDRLRVRVDQLGIRVAAWEIADRDRPVVRVRRGVLELAAEHPDVIAVAAASAGGSAWAPAAVDLLAAHVLNVLNDELTDVTDATEATALHKLLAGS